MTGKGAVRAGDDYSKMEDIGFCFCGGVAEIINISIVWKQFI